MYSSYLWNMVIASYIGEDVQYVTADFPKRDLVAFNAERYQLKTNDSRNVLPKNGLIGSYCNIGASFNVISTLTQGDLLTAGRSNRV